MRRGAPDAANGDLIAGRYAIVSELARGGMGIVYRVDDRSTGRPLALKRSMGDEPLAFESNSMLLEREYRTLVWLRHPRIIQVYDFGSDDQGSFYTMELLDGSDLRARSPLPWQEICLHVRDIASSLALLHSRRLAHRDVTPRNIRLTSDGTAKLIDFGALASFGKCSVIAGTPTSIAPEALDGNDIDHRVDLFALGAAAYYALTGRHAYPATELDDLPATWARGAPAPPSTHCPGIPEKLDELVLSLLSLDRALRPSSAAEVMDRIGAIAGLPPEKDTRIARSYLVSQELVGRERELARVTARLERAIGARGSALVFEAERGLGKSALLDRIASDARVRGATVLHVSARAYATPLGVCRALVQGALRELGESAKVVARGHGILAPEPTRGGQTTRLPSSGSIHPSASEPELADFFLELTVATPLVIVVDDLHCADSISASVVTRLAKASTRQRLLVVAAVDTTDPGRSGAALSLFRRSALRMRLRPFSDDQAIQLVRSMFGEIPSTRRLGAWLQMHSAGNPALSAELLGHLVDQGRIHYAEGTWALPNDLPDEDVHAIVTSATQKRIQRLPKDMLRLAECLSPYQRNSFDLETCRALQEFDPVLAKCGIDGLLEGLLYEGILVGSDEGYVFAQPRVREVLYESLDSARRRKLHAFIASRLAEGADESPERSFDVGCHLLAAGDRIGARAYIGPSVWEVSTRPDALVRAVPQLRDLRSLYRTMGGSEEEQLAVCIGLVISGYYVDPRYHDEFGDRTVLQMYRMSGFHVANRLLRLGSYPALIIGLLWGLMAIVWHWLATVGRSGFAILPRGSRNPFLSFVGVLHGFVGVCAARSAVAYLRLEPRTHELLRSLFASTRRLHEDNGLRLVHDLFSVGVAETHGELETAYEGYQDQLRRTPKVRLFNEQSRHQYEAGMLCSFGRVGLLRGGDLALECADRVDAMGGEHDRIFAQALRRAHYLYRGETTKAQDAEDRLDAMAARYGYRWVPDALGIQ
ncbi:MAG: protein kinase domain-containing protein, partial [Polyangiaceae bacterium]